MEKNISSYQKNEKRKVCLPLPHNCLILSTINQLKRTPRIVICEYTLYIMFVKKGSRMVKVAGMKQNILMHSNNVALITLFSQSTFPFLSTMTYLQLKSKTKSMESNLTCWSLIFFIWFMILFLTQISR